MKKFFSVNGKEYKTEDYADGKPGLVGESKTKKEDNTNDKSDDGEGMDPVGQEDDDVDNDDKGYDNGADDDANLMIETKMCFC